MVVDGPARASGLLVVGELMPPTALSGWTGGTAPGDRRHRAGDEPVAPDSLPAAAHRRQVRPRTGASGAYLGEEQVELPRTRRAAMPDLGSAETQMQTPLQLSKTCHSMPTPRRGASDQTVIYASDAAEPDPRRMSRQRLKHGEAGRMPAALPDLVG